MPPPVLDELGRLKEEQPPDMWPARSGIAASLKTISPLLPEDQIPVLFEFLVPTALNDRAPVVRSGMREAALAAVQAHGKVSQCCQKYKTLSILYMI